MQPAPKTGLMKIVPAALLVIAATGVVIQIVSGAPYPTVPPVFFILLIPAALTGFWQRWWAYLLVVLAGVFLTFGLFSSRAYFRLIHPNTLADTIGLWMQVVATILAVVASIFLWPAKRAGTRA